VPGDIGLAGQQVDAHGLQGRQLSKGAVLPAFHPEREDGRADTVTPALLDRADGTPSAAYYARLGKPSEMSRTVLPKFVEHLAYRLHGRAALG